MARERALGAKSAKGLVCGGVVDWGGELNRQEKGNGVILKLHATLTTQEDFDEFKPKSAVKITAEISRKLI